MSQNKLEKLPSDEDPVKREQGKKTGYNLPVIEELCCQNNRLESIPDQIFNLPSLTVLDLSNNKLQKLPANMWVAPQLKELNVSLNLLQNLPASTQTVRRIMGFFTNHVCHVMFSDNLGSLILRLKCPKK